MNIYMIMILSAIPYTASMWNLQENTDQEDLMAAALTSIIETFYLQRTTNVFVTSNRTDATHNAILRKVFGVLDKNTPCCTRILHDDKYLNGNVDRFTNIILIDSYESFGSIFESVSNTSLEHFGLYTVAITNFHDDSDLNSKLTVILSAFWRHMILNVNILTYCRRNESLLVHTYFPFAPSHCNKVVPVILNAFENDRFVQIDQHLFPVKTDNLFQCSIPILVAQIRPYIYVTGNHSDGSHDFDGFEYNLLCELAKHSNFRPNITVFWDQYNIADAWNMVFYRDYDMVVGGFIFTPNTEQFLSSTRMYSSDNILVVVPNPRPYSSFETLFFPFKLTIWIVISMTLAVAIIVMKLLQSHGKEFYKFVVGALNPTPYFSLLRVLLTGETLYMPNGSVARFILMVWMLTCLVLRTVYQGQLFEFMTTNATVASVKSVDELVDRGISIKLINESYIDFFKYDYARFKKLLICVNGSADYEFVTETEGFVTMEIQLIDEIRRKKPETRPNAIKIVLAPHVFLLPMRYYLTDQMDDLISIVNEIGLMSKWTAPYEGSSAAITGNVVQRSPRKLNILQILGVVEVCFGAVILSILVFVCELLSHRNGRETESTDRA